MSDKLNKYPVTKNMREIIQASICFNKFSKVIEAQMILSLNDEVKLIDKKRKTNPQNSIIKVVEGIKVAKDLGLDDLQDTLEIIKSYPKDYKNGALCEIVWDRYENEILDCLHETFSNEEFIALAKEIGGVTVSHNTFDYPSDCKVLQDKYSEVIDGVKFFSQITDSAWLLEDHAYSQTCIHCEEELHLITTSGCYSVEREVEHVFKEFMSKIELNF